jgi:DNA-binding transcriptional MerR regulator
LTRWKPRRVIKEVTLLKAEEAPNDSDPAMTIGDVAGKLGITLRTLRFYEQKGLIQPDRQGTWTRRYRNRDVERLRLILRLRGAGLALSDIRQVLDVTAARPASKSDLAAIFTARLTGIATERARLDAEESAVSGLIHDLVDGSGAVT